MPKIVISTSSFNVAASSALTSLASAGYALLGESDIVTLHMPSAPFKEPVITAERLALMKRGAILVNTSRGDLVDEDALAAAALDTFANEPHSGPLAKLEQVTLTAHMRSYAEEARATMEEAAARNLLEALAARGLAPTAAAG